MWWKSPHEPASTEVRGHLCRRIAGHMNPDVDVRVAAEVPDECRTLQPPVVPLACLAERVLPVHDQVALLQPALLSQALHDLGAECRTIGVEKSVQNLAHRLFLVAAHVRYGQARQ